jgi:UDP-glucose:(heptosyl)LPS alpha-1,3-glucosyltransferase
MSVQSRRELVPLDDGAVVASPEYVEPLREAGLADFDAVMNTTRGRRLRQLRDRENWRIEFDAPHAGPHGAYLKKHHEHGWLAWLAGRGWLRSTSPGQIEAENVHRLQCDGIAAMQLVAYGERTQPDGLRESFVIVEELVGYEQLDHFLRRRFAPLAEQTAAERRDLRQLFAAVAVVARRFHACGYNHRDFYCCHFFIRETTPGQFDVRLIDLQRVEQRRWLRGRWIIKDLAQFAYSTPRERVSCTAQLRLAKQYLGVDRLRARDKRLIRAVLAKRDGMIRRLGAHP